MNRRLLQMAWRNLWRNPRRTLITMIAIALGYAMLLLFACLLEGLQQQMVENGTRLGLSHVQVHAPGYAPDRSPYKTLGGTEGTNVGGLLAIVTADPRVRAAAPRVYGYGLVSRRRIVWSVSLVFVMAAVMALYPALKAARTELPAALRVW